MTVWLQGDGNLIDVLVEPHLGETFTVCANSLDQLAEIAKIAPEPPFEPIHDCKFNWAVHVPMNRVMPKGWEFLEHKHRYSAEQLEKPISPFAAEWYWEACRIFDDEGYNLDQIEGKYGYELLAEPQQILQDLQALHLRDISLVPVYGKPHNQQFISRPAEEWDVHADEWEEVDDDEGDN